MNSTGETSATGGSATSQAAWLDRRAWSPKRWVCLTVLVITILGPVQLSVIAVRGASALVPRPGSLWALIGWFVVLTTLSVASAVTVQRSLKRIAPSRAVLLLSLVYPDQTTSRFSAALRSGTGKQLAQRAARASGEEQVAARALMRMLDEMRHHDRLTRGHIERVRAFSVLLGQEVGLSAQELDKLSWAALAHDMGKLEVPADLLNKQGRPTEAEWQVLRSHPGAGAEHVEVLRPWLGDWVDAATQHHERHDGKGYPLGLAGTQIGLSGRIVAIADAFDVMTAARSYKPPLPAAQARVELLNNAGTQFDPELVRAFLRISVGEMRWVAGPMGWLSNLPQVLRAPAAGLASSPGVAAAVAASLMIVPTTASTLIAAPVEPTLERATIVDPATADRTSDPGSPVVVQIQADQRSPMASRLPPSATPSTMPTTTTMSVAKTTPTSSTTTTSTTTTSTTTTSTTTAAGPWTGQMRAVDDDYRVGSGRSTVLNVHQNDDYGGVDKGETTVVSGPSKGTAVVRGNNIEYQPAEGAKGNDVFTYRVCNAAGSCDTAQVTLTIDAD